VLSKQLLRSGTSVGAMVREAEHAATKIDFKHKLGIAQKEINETIYWLELLKDIEYLTNEKFIGIHIDAVESLNELQLL
jgi:four helix bundle protein